MSATENSEVKDVAIEPEQTVKAASQETSASADETPPRPRRKKAPRKPRKSASAEDAPKAADDAEAPKATVSEPAVDKDADAQAADDNSPTKNESKRTRAPKSAKPVEDTSHHEIPVDKIDADAMWVVRRLRAKGYEAYLTGGCVRDLLLGRDPKDFDVATAAHPNQVKSVFRNCRLVGRRFRLAHVIFAGGKVIETATFRKNPGSAVEEEEVSTQDTADEANEEAVLDAPHTGAEAAETAGDGAETENGKESQSDKDSGEGLLVERDNEFGNVEEDALRRDFTINGLFYDPIEGKVIDYVDGRADLDKRLIRSIGDPAIRFQEDPVRMLRAIKFATRMDFILDDSVKDAIKAHAEELLKCSPARLVEEMTKLFSSGHAASAFEMSDSFGVIKALYPGFHEAMDADRVAPAATETPVSIETKDKDEAAAPEEAAASKSAAKVIDIEAFAADDDDDDEPVGIAAQLSEEPTGNDTSKANHPEQSPGRLPDVEPPLTKDERWSLFNGMLKGLDEVSARGADINASTVLSVFTYPACQAAGAGGLDAGQFFDSLCEQWMPKLRFTRRDKETSRYVLLGLGQFAPGWRYGAPAKTLVSRSWFRDALLLKVLIAHARGEGFEEIGKWKVMAQHHNKKFKQLRKGERVSRPRRTRRPRNQSRGRSRGRRASS